MFDIDKIVQKIADKIAPALEAGKKQAELNTLIQSATAIYCAQIMRGGNPIAKTCVSQAKELINESR